MRTSSLLTIALVPAALIAQAPAPAAAPAPAPLTFSQQFRANGPAIEALLKAFQPEEALAKAEALLPATKPTFDKSDVNAGRRSSFQFSDLARTYHLAGKCAQAAGNWEKGRDYLMKAQEVAKENLEETTAVVTPAIDAWKAPMETAHKALEDGAARLAELTAKQPPLTADEDAELKNFQVHQQNIVNGEKISKVLGQDISGTKTELGAFGPMIESMQKNITDENAEIEKNVADKKFKGSKDKYFAALLNGKNLETQTTKLGKLSLLYRLKFHCAGTPEADKVKAVIDRVRLDQDPFPVEKPAKKKKNS